MTTKTSLPGTHSSTDFHDLNAHLIKPQPQQQHTLFTTDEEVEEEESDDQSSPPTFPNITWLQIIGGSIGNILEWYDFAIFGFLVSEIGREFFPSSNHSLSMIKAYGVFGGAFLCRPLGGIFFGFIGDKYGRKRALQLSIMLMMLVTLSIGLLPTYHQIGIAATVILTLLRMLQGISAGGQLVGSILFLVESSPVEQRAYYGGLAMSTAVLGGITGSLVVSIVDGILTNQQMRDYGWRIPFLMSILLGVIGAVIQHQMPDSKLFLQAKRRKLTLKNPFQQAVSRYWRIIIYIMLVVTPWALGGYLTFTWLPTYLSKELYPKTYEFAFVINTVMLGWEMICIIFTGYLLSNVPYFAGFNYLYLMKYSCLICMLVVYPLYIFMYQSHETCLPMILCQIIVATVKGAFGGCLQIFLVDCVDDVVLRYSVIGIAYNASQALLGGTAPIIATSIAMEDFTMVGVYYALMNLIAVLLLQFYHPQRLQQQSKKQVENNLNKLEFQPIQIEHE